MDAVRFIGWVGKVGEPCSDGRTIVDLELPTQPIPLKANGIQVGVVDNCWFDPAATISVSGWVWGETAGKMRDGHDLAVEFGLSETTLVNLPSEAVEVAKLLTTPDARIDMTGRLAYVAIANGAPVFQNAAIAHDHGWVLKV